MVYRILADLVMVAHFAFVLLVIFGGLAVLRWRRFAWIHIPAAVWGAVVEMTGWICPLTPLEVMLRERGGGTGYRSSFVEHYIMPVLYPTELTRPMQIALGAGVILLNVLVYGLVLRRWRRMRSMTNTLALATFLSLSAAFASAAAPVERFALENGRVTVTVDPAAGSFSVLDKACGYLWQPPPPGDRNPGGARFRNVRSSPRSIAFEADFGWPAAAGMVTMTLAGETPDLAIDLDMSDRNRAISNLHFLPLLILDTPAGVLAVADYSNGHLYPLGEKPFPRTWFGGDRLDMPWVGVCDLAKGMGYLLILETSDDAAVQMRPCKVGDREVAAPEIIWLPSKGVFGAPRRILFHFASEGGYVALAKAYRRHAQAAGLVVPFSEKLTQNPNIRRLFGAPDVWGDATAKFAREAKAAGVEKMLIHGRASPRDVKEINDLGYLTSEYDNYTDITPVGEGKEIDAQHDRLPDAAVLNADGKRMTAWLTWDKKTQFMKRCPALWVRTENIVVPKVLSAFPFVGRFIDVTTAEGLYECYDPNHPLTRADKRRCGVDLLAAVRGRKLVVGGEHGIWWAVPHLDYIEGMMSGGYYSWPAGHLIHPKSKDESFTDPWGGATGRWDGYEKWGIGHRFRAPLWELVFHDCVVSTWYWGDASDWLRQAAPEVTDAKDALNILYGTVPLLWANKEGSWQADRAMFLRTYRRTCKLHEAIAGAEMLSHEFMTPDRDVQRTTFSDGTAVIVNFGKAAFTLTLDGGGTAVLPQYGFWVKGPAIEQSRILVDGKPVTTIRAGEFSFTDKEDPSR
jgi:hypothetical protein